MTPGVAPLLPAVDDEPERWADTEHPDATADEIAAGNRLGETIAVDDDTDRGGIETVRPPR